MTTKITHKQAQILGTYVSSTTRMRVLRFVRERLSKFDKKDVKSQKFYIVTPYSEMILKARVDGRLRTIINSADISLPDGIGVAHAAKYLSLRNPSNAILRAVLSVLQGVIVGLSTFVNKDWLFGEITPIKGRVVFVELIKLANKLGWRVFFLGGEHGEARLAASKLSMSYKKIKIETDGGPMLTEDGNPRTKADAKIQRRVVSTIAKFKPHLLFVAFGPPKQEKWLVNNLGRLDIGGAMMIGGTFNYISGLSKIPPTWVDNLGLESFWRLVGEPKRLVRILRALIVFPIYVYLEKIRKTSSNTP